MSTERIVVLDGRRRIPTLVVRASRPPGEEVSPVIAFGHGFLQRPQLYGSLLGALASRGYTVVGPDTETGPVPGHGRLADDLWRVAEWGQAEVGGSGIVLAGHSMGAGVALLAASRHPEVDAVVALAALQTRPRIPLERLATPALVVAGSQDRIVKPERTRELYEHMASADWALIEGGYHCGFLDRARWRDAGCDHGDLPRSDQLDLTARLVGDWLDARFRGGTFTAPAGVALEHH